MKVSTVTSILITGMLIIGCSTHQPRDEKQSTPTASAPPDTEEESSALPTYSPADIATRLKQQMQAYRATLAERVDNHVNPAYTRNSDEMDYAFDTFSQDVQNRMRQVIQTYGRAKVKEPELGNAFNTRLNIGIDGKVTTCSVKELDDKEGLAELQSALCSVPESVYFGRKNEDIGAHEETIQLVIPKHS